MRKLCRKRSAASAVSKYIVEAVRATLGGNNVLARENGDVIECLESRRLFALTITTLGAGVNDSPILDWSGNAYFKTNDQVIHRLDAKTHTLTDYAKPTTSFFPQAVDPQGNLFGQTTGANVAELPAGSNTVVSLAQIPNESILYMDCDASGNLYGIAENENNSSGTPLNGVLFTVPASNHTYKVTATAASVTSYSFLPYQMMCDAKGNVLISNGTNPNNQSYYKQDLLRSTVASPQPVVAGSFNQNLLGAQYQSLSRLQTIDANGQAYGLFVPRADYYPTAPSFLYTTNAASGGISILTTFPAGTAPGYLRADSAGSLFGYYSTGGANNAGRIVKISTTTGVMTTAADMPAGTPTLYGLEYTAPGRFIALTYNSAAFSYNAVDINLGGTTSSQPVATANAATVAEGKTVALAGSGTPGTGAASIAKYEWDLNYDGTTFTTDSTTQKPTFTAAAIDGPATRKVALRVTDSAGKVSAVATAVVTITNAAPTATFKTTGAAAGKPIAAAFSGASDFTADVTAGLKYSFDFNNDGDFTDAGDVGASAAATASFTFAAAGTYTVRGRVTDKDGGFTDYTQSVTVTGTTTTGSLAGFAFDDTDKDGVYDAGETKSAGKTVFLDLDNDGALGSNEKKTTTASDGSWSFTGLAAGTYHVRRVFPSGYVSSTPLIDVTLTAGQSVGGLTIGSKPKSAVDPNTASISGVAFNDTNKNGLYDGTDTLAAGKTVWLDLDDDGVKDANEASVVTASNGTFSFKNLAAGKYHVRRLFPSGYLESTPARYITLTSGQAAGGVLIGSKAK